MEDTISKVKQTNLVSRLNYYPKLIYNKIINPPATIILGTTEECIEEIIFTKIRNEKENRSNKYSNELIISRLQNYYVREEDKDKLIDSLYTSIYDELPGSVTTNSFEIVESKKKTCLVINILSLSSAIVNFFLGNIIIGLMSSSISYLSISAIKSAKNEENELFNYNHLSMMQREDLEKVLNKNKDEYLKLIHNEN